MNKTEAQVFLKLSDEISLEDAYNDRLFEWKNFFVNRFPVSKLFNGKIQQLHRLEEAYTVLGGVHDVKSHGPETPEFEHELLSAFQVYAFERNKLRLLMFSATTAMELKHVVHQMIDLTRAYAVMWEVQNVALEGVVVSKEPDPMDLLSALQNAKTLGVETKDEILKLPDDHLVLRESKRLSLWLKMEANA